MYALSLDVLRKHLDKIFGSFCICTKCDLRNLEADVTSCVNRAAGIDFLCENIAFNNNINNTILHSF